MGLVYPWRAATNAESGDDWAGIRGRYSEDRRGSPPLGLANKLFLRLDGTLPGAEDELFLVGSTVRCETMSYQVRPLGRPSIQCFFGGRFAVLLERDGIAAMAAFAADELAGLFGSGIRRQLSPLASSVWRGEHFARGSYSYAQPGHAHGRARLAEPVDNRILFAGEACSLGFFSTAHGAYETGTGPLKPRSPALRAKRRGGAR